MKNGSQQPAHGGQCGARTRSGAPCKLPAGFKTPHQGTGSCHLHAGNTPNHITAAAEVQARQAAEKFGVPIVTTARQALIDELARANGMVIWLTARCQELDAEGLVWGTERKLIRTNPGSGADRREPQIEVTQAARLHPYASWLERAERHLFAVAAEMARIGIEQRQARVNEQLVGEFRRVTDAMLAQLDLTPEQRELIPAAAAAAVARLHAV